MTTTPQTYPIYLVFITFFFVSCLADSTNTHSIEPKVTLGHYLFFEKKISLNQTKSCASCHAPQFAFTDGYRTSVTALGENVKHNAPSLINIALHKRFDWQHPDVTSLAQQIKRPLYGTHPVELGTQKAIPNIAWLIKNDSLYHSLWEKAFPVRLNTIEAEVEQAIVAYVSVLQSHQSKFDLFLSGREEVLNMSERNGFQLFCSKRLQCSTCHPPPEFTLATQTNQIDRIYRNTGLYACQSTQLYPFHDPGISVYTQKKSDNGKFKIPSLRNIMLTSPYMHDGSVATLSEVLDIYALGGRIMMQGPYQGDGRLHPYKDSLIGGFILTPDEKKDLLAFFQTLTDSSIFTNKLFQYPEKN